MLFANAGGNAVDELEEPGLIIELLVIKASVDAHALTIEDSCPVGST